MENQVFNSMIICEFLLSVLIWSDSGDVQPSKRVVQSVEAVSAREVRGDLDYSPWHQSVFVRPSCESELQHSSSSHFAFLTIVGSSGPPRVTVPEERNVDRLFVCSWLSSISVESSFLTNSVKCLLPKAATIPDFW